MEPQAQNAYPKPLGLRFYTMKHGVVFHLNLLLHITHLLAEGETWLPLTKRHFPYNPIQWCLVWFSLPTGQGARSALCFLSIATSWPGCFPGSSLLPSFSKYCSTQHPRILCWLSCYLHVIIQKSKISLCLDNFMSILWSWPLRNMWSSTDPSLHLQVFKCWGFPVIKVAPIVIHVFQTYPSTSCHRESGLLGLFFHPERKGKKKGDPPAGVGEEF